MATWTISTMEQQHGDDGGVIVAHWRVTDSETVGDDTYYARSYGTCSFTYLTHLLMTSYLTQTLLSLLYWAGAGTLTWTRMLSRRH